MFMKKMRKVLWKKGFLSFVLTVSFLAGAYHTRRLCTSGCTGCYSCYVILKRSNRCMQWKCDSI